MFFGEGRTLQSTRLGLVAARTARNTRSKTESLILVLTQVLMHLQGFTTLKCLLLLLLLFPNKKGGDKKIGLVSLSISNWTSQGALHIKGMQQRRGKNER